MKKEKRFGERLKRLRKIAGLTQVEIASLVQYSRSSIEKFETGHKTPPVRWQENILEVVENHIRKHETLRTHT